MIGAALMLVGLALDALIGWPKALYERISHPVVWIGALISGLEARWNAGTDRARFWSGALLVLVLIGAAALPMALVQAMLPGGYLGLFIGGVIAWPFIASRSMWEHVSAVAQPLKAGDLSAARYAVSMIVGRDPEHLDEAGVARAALESLAENTSDGIIAPLFWGVVAGLPGIAAYKAINTADSMIGHRNTRYEHFGKAAARLDDLVNLVPARLTGLLFALCSNAPRRALQVMWRDAGLHRSPNAGWPEGAMAPSLGIRLSGPRSYDGGMTDEPWVHAEGADAQADDIAAGLALYLRAMFVTAGMLALLAII